MRRTILEVLWASVTAILGLIGSVGGFIAQVCVVLLVVMAAFIALSNVYSYIFKKEGATT